MMKKVFFLIIVLLALPCISSVSIADANVETEKKTKIEKLPPPYSASDLYGYWFDVNNTSEISILKWMDLGQDGVAIDSLLIQVGDNVEEIKQESLWKFDPKASLLTQEITNITHTINGKIEPNDFGDVEPVKVFVTIRKRGGDIFLGLVSADGTLNIYQKITEEMKSEIHKKAQENVSL